MRKKSILKYSISLLLLCAPIYIKAQTNQTEENIHYYPQRYGLRVGADLFSLSRNLYDKDFSGFEINADYRLKKKIFAAVELGTTEITKDEENLYNFTTKGHYIKLGFDYNLHENWMNREDMIYVGFRYGFSTFSQTLNSYNIYTTNPYFEEGTVTLNKAYDGLTAHWAEMILGIKTRVFNNVFMGFNFQLKALLAQKQPEDFENLYIPGYNKKYSGGIGVGFNYNVTYFIPLYKSKNDAFSIPTDKKSKEEIEFDSLEK